MKRINHMPGTLEVCVTRHGTLSGPIQTDITGFEEITPYKAAGAVTMSGRRYSMPKFARIYATWPRLGRQALQGRLQGCVLHGFSARYRRWHSLPGEVNPRISGASPLTNLITAHYGGVPLFLFHLLEYLDVDYEIDLRKVQNRWNE